MKKGVFIFFALVLLGVPIFLVVKSESVLENGIQHKIRLRAYDPFDPFRGKYLSLNYENTIPCDEILERGDVCYVTLKKGEDGFSTFDYMHSEKPEGEDYIESRVDWLVIGTGSFKTDNISKYFINEHKASRAETVLIEYSQDCPDDIYVAIRVLDGEVRLEDIFVEETPLLDFLDQHPELVSED